MSSLVLAQQTIEINSSAIALVGYGLGAIGPGIGVGLIWAAVINGTARQPEAEGKLKAIAWMTFVLTEVLALIGMVLYFISG